jgi:hypothetical protein
LTTYKVVRFYQQHPARALRLRRGLTLEQAQAHCQNPETSSRTCTTAEGHRRTELMGPWFDGYTEETKP